MRWIDLIVGAMALLAVSAAPAAAQPGEAVFNDICAVCHQKGGIGTAGLAPSLISQSLKQTLAAQPDYVARVIVQGLSGPIISDGQRFISAMPGQAQLTNAEIADLANYVMGALNGLNQRLVDSDVRAVRDLPVDHTALRALRASP